MNKTTLSTLLAGLCAVSQVSGADYSTSLTGIKNWDDASIWVKAGGGSGVPGAGDNITDISTTGTTFNLHLNGERTVGNLTKEGAYNFRILSGSTSASGAASLTVTGTFALEQNTISLRSKDADSPLTLTVGNLKVGTFEEGRNTARFNIADSANSGYLSIKVLGRTTIAGSNNAAILFNNDLQPTAQIDLGDVIFQESTGGSPGLATGNATINVRSLTTLNKEGTGPNTLGTAAISGSGIIAIYGDAHETHDFNGSITGAVAIEKKGSDTQILSALANTVNSYTGGTTIKEGVLAIRNTLSSTGGNTRSALGKGAVTVEKNGTLAGAGVINLAADKEIVVDGTVAPGADGSGDFNQLIINGFLSSGTRTGRLLVMNEDSAFTFNLNATGQSDSVRFLYYRSGDLALSEHGVAVNVTGALQEGVVYQLFSFQTTTTSSAAIGSGLTGGLLMGSGFDGYSATFHYDEAGFGGTGTISMTVAAIPEAGALAFFLPSALLLGMMTMRSRFPGCPVA